MRKVQLSYKVYFVFGEANIGKGISFLEKKKKEQNLESQSFQKTGRKYNKMSQHLVLDGRIMIGSPPLPRFISDFFKNYTEITLSLSSYKNKFIDQLFRNGGFPGGTVVESLPANAGDTGSSPGLGRSHMPWSN